MRPRGGESKVKRDRGDQLFAEARKYFVGGACAGARFSQTLGRPLYITNANGSCLFDVDGNRFIDYHLSSGATLIGYNDPAIKEALVKALDVGYFCNYETTLHTELAQLICASVPSAEQVRLANSGTEAVIWALRLARAVTGRKKIIKFEGHFHGMHELTYFNCHTRLSDVHKNGEIEIVHDSPGIPEDFANVVIVLPFNEPEIFRTCMKNHQGEIAAVIMEPVMYNAGCILPKKEFVQVVRDETARAETVLIFDEVLSGFRMCLGGGQEYLGITPDLTTLAKALGGSGIPIAAIVGKKSVMRELNPEGKTIVSGTYSGHLLKVAGSLAALKILSAQGFYEQINATATRLYGGLEEIIKRKGIKAVVQGLGARFTIYFGLEEKPVLDYRYVVNNFNLPMYKKFLKGAIERGLYFHDSGSTFSPNHFGFSHAHTVADIDETLQKIDDVFASGF
jgi:glutamate-1-semialdehyde 2,1-aminomutase